MNVVVLGNVCIDKNRVEEKEYESAGGPAIFISGFLEEKGENVTVISSYGADFLAFEQGLNLYPSKPNLSESLVYRNIVKNGKRTQKCHFYNQLPPEIDAKMKQILKNADILFITPLTPYFSPNYVKKIVRLTSKNCLKILLPQGYFRDFDSKDNVTFREFKERNELLPLVDFVILSHEDYPNIEELSFEWSKSYEITFIITKAEEGAIVINKDIKIDVPTDPIPNNIIVNPIGDGDIFAAAFSYNYFKIKDLKESVKLANKSAREKLLNT